MILRPTHPIDGMPPGADYRVTGEDACHFFITPMRFDGPVFRLPRRNVYIVGQRFEGQVTERQISESLTAA